MDQEQMDRILNNIDALRKAYGESYEDLATSIGYSDKGGVGNWFNRRSIKDISRLEKVAAHYRVPLSLLLNSDLTAFSINFEDLSNPEFQIKRFFFMFPLAFSDAAFEDPLFDKAFQLHKEYIEQGLRAKFYDSVKLDELCATYDRSFEENGTIESYINLIHFRILEEISFKNPWILKLNGTELGTKYFSKKILPSFEFSFDCDEDTEIPVDDVHKIEENVLFALRKIKQVNRYSDLADFYMALRYLFAVPDNELSWADNNMVGGEMIASLALLGNKYAIMFYEEFQGNQNK